MDSKERRLTIFIFAVVVLFFSLGASNQTPKNTKSIEEQWKISPHAMSMDSPEERDRMNAPGCAHCHTAQGYWEEILEGKKSSAPYKDVIGLTCEACHFLDQMTDGSPALRSGGSEKACTGCHDILVQNDASGFSSCLQGSMLRGEGGEEFEGKSYGTSSHSKVEKNCAGCHMAPVAEKDKNVHVGGHTFRVITKQRAPRVFNPAGCMKCHDSITLDDVDNSQKEIKVLMEALRKLLPKSKGDSSDAQSGEPRLPKDLALSKKESMASYNYYFILKDGTSGIHNPVYIKKLLEDSIEALKAEHQ